jgi:hypothetical protein
MILTKGLARGLIRNAKLSRLPGVEWRFGMLRLNRWFSAPKEQTPDDKVDSQDLQENAAMTVEDPAGETSGGFVYKKNAEVTKEYAIPGEKLITEQPILKELTFPSYFIMNPMLPISSIVAGRRSFYILLGIFTSIATAFYYTGHPYICGIFCFLAASPLTYIRQSRKVLLNKILQVKLHEDMKRVDLTTAYKTYTTNISDIKLGKNAIRNMAEGRAKFEEVKRPDFLVPDSSVPLGLPLFVKIPIASKQQEMVIDLDHLLFRIDNFDLFSDIMNGNEAAVTEYQKIEPAKPERQTN